MLNALRHVWRHPLNAKAPLAGMARFVRWQLATSLLPGAAVAIPFTDRARLLVARGMYGATQNVYCGLNDFPEMSLLLHYLREGDLFLDVGANVGVYTVLASAAARATSYAFEPSDTALEHLRNNVALNQIGALVHVEACAVGRTNGRILLDMGGASAMHHVVQTAARATQGRSVEMRALDSYDLRPAILKIDVEGYEAEVLAGAKQTLACPELVAVIAENSDDDVKYGEGLKSVQASMEEHGFVPVRYDPWQRDVIVDHERRDNTIYMRYLDRVKERVASAAPFRVFGRSI